MNVNGSPSGLATGISWWPDQFSGMQPDQEIDRNVHAQPHMQNTHSALGTTRYLVRVSVYLKRNAAAYAMCLLRLALQPANSIAAQTKNMMSCSWCNWWWNSWYVTLKMKLMMRLMMTYSWWVTHAELPMMSFSWLITYDDATHDELLMMSYS